MDEKITEFMDGLDIAEAEMLLDSDMKMAIDRKTLSRIKSSVYRKAGLRRNIHVPQRLLAAAASFIIVAFLFFAGLDSISAAINQIFSFIPGYGIIENNDGIVYILSASARDENDAAILTLNNAIAGRDSITVMATLERKDYTEEQLLDDKLEEAERMAKGAAYEGPKLSLYVNDNKYTEYGGSSSGNGQKDTFSFTYTVAPGDIDINSIYSLADENFDLRLDFGLKGYDSYGALAEIGPTDCKNDISITAVPTFKGDKLEVNLYPINKSGYRIETFFRQGGYLGNDLHIEAESGVKAYIPPDSYGSAHGTFMFNVDPDDRAFDLKIPFIIVQSIEERNITLKIPETGRKLTTDHKIDFKDCTVTIAELERTSEYFEDYGELKMTLRYDNKSSNRTMIGSNIFRTDFWGGVKGGGYSWEADENGIMTTVYFALEKGEDSALRLKFARPEYYLTDGYALSFGR